MSRSFRLLFVLALLGLSGATWFLPRTVPPGAVVATTHPGAEPHEAKRGPELIRAFFEDWHDPFPGELSTEVQRRLWSEVEEVPRAAKALGDPWQSYGPAGMTTLPGLHTGRVLDLDLGPGGLRRLAAASGGVWRREAQGWNAITEGLTTQWIGSLDTSPVDSNLVLVGTGEPWIRPGTGLWRSTDGGATWQNDPLPASPATCFRLRFHPNGQTVVGAFDLGIYRSADAGVTWTRIPLAHWPTDLARHPTNPSVLWTPVYEHGLWRSEDDGRTWSQVQGVGLPTSGNGRGAVAVAASDPDRLYVAFAAPTNDMLGVFRSDDGGASWTEITPPDDYFWGQGWYNNSIGVSPLDPDVVLAGGGGLQRSVDGGLTWTTTATPHVHADVHAIEWTADGSQLFVATDGGFSHSTDDGATYDTTNNLMPITQFVNVDVTTGARFAMAGGSQDNGISVSIDGGTTWRQAFGGDGGGVELDDFELGDMWVTSGIFGGNLPFRTLRSGNFGASWTEASTGIQPSGAWFTRVRSNQVRWFYTVYTNNGPWIYSTNRNGSTWTPVNQSAFPSPVREFTVKSDGDFNVVIYACLDSSTPGERLRVYEGGSRDGSGTWQERSTGLVAGVRVRKVVPHPIDPDRCFALMNGMGTPGQKVYRSEDRGLTWENVSGNLPDLPLGDLVAHPFEPDRWYLGTEFGCYRTVDAGITWERWNEGMPDAAIVTEMVLVDRLDDTGELLVAAGTYGRGLWMRPIPEQVTAAGAPMESSTRVWLAPGVPNPARGAAEFRFRLPRPGAVLVRVFDVRGRRVATPLRGSRPAGEHGFTLRTEDLAAGTYFVRLQFGEEEVSRKLTILD